MRIPDWQLSILETADETRLETKHTPLELIVFLSLSLLVTNSMWAFCVELVNSQLVCAARMFGLRDVLGGGTPPWHFEILRSWNVELFINSKCNLAQHLSISRFQHFKISRFQDFKTCTTTHFSRFQDSRISGYKLAHVDNVFKFCMPDPRYWILKNHNVEKLKSWSFQSWNLEMLTSWSVEILKCWSLEILGPVRRVFFVCFFFFGHHYGFQMTKRVIWLECSISFVFSGLKIPTNNHRSVLGRCCSQVEASGVRKCGFNISLIPIILKIKVLKCLVK